MSARPDKAVIAAIDAHPRGISAPLKRLRALIYDVAAKTPEIGELSETLKWGQPSYTPVKSGVGSSVRLGMTSSGSPALFFICHTNMVGHFRELYTGDLDFEGNRAIVLHTVGDWPEQPLRHCIAIALTWKMARARSD